MPAPLMWAYAGGVLRRYGNAAEDIEDSIAKGFAVIELDFARTRDGVPAVTHFFKPEDNPNEWDHIPLAQEFKAKRVNGRFSPLLFDDVVSRYGESGAFFSLDPFYYYCHVKDGEREFREYVLRHTSRIQRDRLILQIYSFRSLCEMKRLCNEFGALHYVVGVGNLWKVRHLVPVLTSVGVHSISFQDCEITDEFREAVSLCREANIHVSVAGVETVERYRAVIAAGADCVNTMRLTPKEVML